LIKYLIVFALLALVLPAQADTLWNQPWDGVSSSVTSTEYTYALYASYSCRAFDDFTVGPGGWTVQKVTVYGYDSGETPKLAFTSSADCSAIGTTYSGTQVGAGSETEFVFDLGSGVYVAPGDWWITSWAVQENGWFWDTTTTVTGSEAYWHNPGDGLGYGTTPTTLQSLVGAPRDLAFKIEGTAVPEAGSLVLAISGIPAMAFFIRRRK
jgi:hypothetical protein